MPGRGIEISQPPARPYSVTDEDFRRQIINNYLARIPHYEDRPDSEARYIDRSDVQQDENESTGRDRQESSDRGYRQQPAIKKRSDQEGYNLTRKQQDRLSKYQSGNSFEVSEFCYEIIDLACLLTLF